ncbi:MAG: alpha/beta-hydrolase family protein, partial [Acidimicrobiales bacterium]
TLEARVDLAMQELERTEAFDREILAVYATTGTGWVDERVADSLEYIWGGNTASVGLQYSYLPSWVSVLVDQKTAVDSSTMLIDAVLARLEQIPADERPRILVFGESLGSFATEAAFDDFDDLIANVDGAMLVGPTFGNEFRNRFTDNRDPGSPAWRPVVEDGRQVRFIVDPDDFDLLTGPWEDPRVVYLKNSSDPISHFSLSLLWSPPEWLDEPRAPDSNPKMNWFPVVTFWQVAADLTYSFGAPAGHGHRYGANVVDAWVEIDAPEGWTDSDTQRLRDIIGHE